MSYPKQNKKEKKRVSIDLFLDDREMKEFEALMELWKTKLKTKSKKDIIWSIVKRNRKLESEILNNKIQNEKSIEQLKLELARDTYVEQYIHNRGNHQDFKQKRRTTTVLPRKSIHLDAMRGLVTTFLKYHFETFDFQENMDLTMFFSLCREYKDYLQKKEISMLVTHNIDKTVTSEEFELMRYLTNDIYQRIEKLKSINAKLKKVPLEIKRKRDLMIPLNQLMDLGEPQVMKHYETEIDKWLVAVKKEKTYQIIFGDKEEDEETKEPEPTGVEARLKGLKIGGEKDA